MTSEHATAIDDRNRAFESDDYAWAAKIMRDASSFEVVKMAFHKARYECLNVSKGKRLESQKWLAENGVKSVNGDPVAIGDDLPK